MHRPPCLLLFVQQNSDGPSPTMPATLTRADNLVSFSRVLITRLPKFVSFIACLVQLFSFCLQLSLLPTRAMFLGLGKTSPSPCRGLELDLDPPSASMGWNTSRHRRSRRRPLWLPLPTRVNPVPAADPRRNYMSPRSTTPAALVTIKRPLRCCALRIATHRLIKPSAATTTLHASSEIKPEA